MNGGLAAWGLVQRGSPFPNTPVYTIPLEMLTLMLSNAKGDIGVLFALIALRHTENGGPGREMGILGIGANTLEEQIHIAANSIRHREALYGQNARDEKTGLYTDAFLEHFSHIYAPVGADNDPQELNRNHAINLQWHYHRCSVHLCI